MNLLVQEIAEAPVSVDGWEAVVTCGPEAAEALRVAASAEPNLQASVTNGGVRLSSSVTPNWAGITHRVKNTALDALLL